MYSKKSYLFNLEKALEPKLQTLRIITTSNRNAILANLAVVSGGKAENLFLSDKYCPFCGSKKNITKEHVIPKWVFEKHNKKDLSNDVHSLVQDVSRATVPACKGCNSDLLNSLEKYLFQLFSKAKSHTFSFSLDQQEHIIRWLEILDYKLNLKYLDKASGSIIFPEMEKLQSNLALPIEPVGRPPVRKILENVRYSLNRIAVKKKSRNINSLVILNPVNKSFHIFHSPNEFLFIQLPFHNLALFHFYDRTFRNKVEAMNEALKIVRAKLVDQMI